MIERHPPNHELRWRLTGQRMRCGSVCTQTYLDCLIEGFPFGHASFHTLLDDAIESLNTSVCLRIVARRAMVTYVVVGEELCELCRNELRSVVC